MIILKNILNVLKTSVITIFTRGNEEKNRQYFSKLFYQYAINTIKINNLNIILSGEENICSNDNRPCIIISNHNNYFDIPILVYIFKGELRFLVKKELRKVPFWGKAMSKSEFIFIDRHDRNEAIESLNFAKEKLKNGIKLLIYPEGTRSKTGKLQQFKKGAFKLAKQIDAKIIPVSIVGLKYGKIPKNENITVHIGQPIDSKNFKSTDDLKNYSWNIINNIIAAKTPHY